MWAWHYVGMAGEHCGDCAAIQEGREAQGEVHGEYLSGKAHGLAVQCAWTSRGLAVRCASPSRGLAVLACQPDMMTHVGSSRMAGAQGETKRRKLGALGPACRGPAVGLSESCLCGAICAVRAGAGLDALAFCSKVARWIPWFSRSYVGFRIS
jgi:hypothetical protein